MAILSTSPPLAWDHPRTAVAARLMVEVGQERGLSVDDCLAGSGVARSSFNDPATIVEATQELAIARNLQRALGDVPGLGLEVGLRYRFTSFGVWGFALLSSTTARELVRLGVRYSALSFAFINPHIEQGSRALRVILDAEDIPLDIRSFFVERELAKLANLLPIGLGRNTGIRFETAFTGERASAMRARFPDVALSFGRPQHVLVLDQDILDLPLPQADPLTVRDLEVQCVQMLEQRRSRRGVAAQVRAFILATLAQAPTMETVAAELHVDPRTLRRQLRADGTSYRELLDEVRQTLADELLAHAGLTVSEVSRRLGYHDAAGFSRAYKRWTGFTPKRNLPGFTDLSDAHRV